MLPLRRNHNQWAKLADGLGAKSHWNMKTWERKSWVRGQGVSEREEQFSSSIETWITFIFGCFPLSSSRHQKRLLAFGFKNQAYLLNNESVYISEDFQSSVILIIYNHYSLAGLTEVKSTGVCLYLLHFFSKSDACNKCNREICLLSSYYSTVHFHHVLCC